MATNERRTLMRNLGLKLLEHAMVEVRDIEWGGKVAVLKDFSEPRLLWLGDPSSLEREYSEHFKFYESTGAQNPLTNYIQAVSGGASPWAYADARLRLEGMFAGPAGWPVLVYGFNQYGDQFYWKLMDGTARHFAPRVDRSTSTHDLRQLRSITPRDIPRDKRADFLWSYSYLLRQADDLDRVRAGDQMQKRLIAMGVRHPGGTYVVVAEPLVYRQRSVGGPISADSYLPLKNALKEIGTLIGKPDARAEDLVVKYRALHETPHGEAFYDQVMRAWNRMHSGEVVSCGCGHIEAAEHVTDARGGVTVCRACIEDEDYVLLEDLQQYDARGNAYEHDDGLFYSYSEPDPDEDYSDSGVRSYSADVRGYLSVDKTIKPSSYGEFLMGVELEVASTDWRGSAVDHTMRTLAPGYAILKNDGSLPEDRGFEIVTAPRGLKEHIRRFSEWEPHKDLRAWDEGCCGMHVHISSQAFTQATLGKFLELINSEENDGFIRAIAGRHPNRDTQAQDYCQRDGCTPGNPKKTLCDKCPDRYYMVNTTNITAAEALRLGLDGRHASGRPQNTIELRVFRASLKKSRLLAQIEFAHAAVMFCRWSSMRELNQKHFLKWLQGMAGIYPNLAKWFGVRGNTNVVEVTPKARAGAEV